MSINEYSCQAIETGSGTIRTASTNVEKMASLCQLHLQMTPEQASNQSVMVALAMLLDNGVKLVHKDGQLTTTFFRS